MTSPLSLPFGDLLRHARVAAGLTQEELAERAGLSTDAISTLERGARRTPRKDTVMLLADALDLSAPECAALHAAARRTASSAPPSEAMPAANLSEMALPTGGFLGALPADPLIAREAELRQALAAIAAVTGGAGRVLLLAGESGIGKTRLAQEVAALARSRGFLVATGRCYEPEQTVAYYPFLETLSLAYAAAPLPVRTALPQRWPEVLRLLPDQQREATVAAEPREALSTDTPMDQQRVLWAVAGFVQALAEQRPVALLLDDLHWADSASFALLKHLARHTRTARVLLLGTYRDVDVTRQHPFDVVLRDLGREQLIAQVHIGALSAKETAALVEASLGIGAVPMQLAALLHQRTEGNPFFTHEVLRVLVERGDIYQHDGGWERRAVAELRVPESVRSVIGERVARLAGSTQQTLGEASVLGQTFEFGDLAGMRTRPEAELEAAIEEATGAGLVRETGDDGYAFHHVLIQQALYEELPARRRQRLHGLAGEALEQLPERVRERRVAELAYHYLHSPARRKALPYLVRAAEHAHAVGAFKEEAALLNPAIELAEKEEQTRLTAELQAKRGLAYFALSTWTEADRELSEALVVLAPDQRELRAQALVALAQIRQFLHDEAANTRRFATEALALADEIGRDDLAASAISALGMVDFFDGDLSASLRHFEQAVVRAGPELLAPVVVGVECSGLVHYWLGDAERAIERERQALDVARQAHNTATTGTMLQNLGLALAATGRYGEGLLAIAEGERVAREHEAWQFLARAKAIHGGVHLAVFDFAGAQALAEEAREISRSANWPHTTISAGIDLLFNYARRYELGRTEHLVDELVEAVAGDQTHKRWLWQLRLPAARAEIALARGQWEEAVRWADEAIVRSRLRGRVKYEVAGLGTYAQALAGLGRKREAITTLRHAVALARPVRDPVMFLQTAALLLVLDGDDALLAEARAAADRIIAALPDDTLVRRFQAAESVRMLEPLTAQPPTR